MAGGLRVSALLCFAPAVTWAFIAGSHVSQRRGVSSTPCAVRMDAPAAARIFELKIPMPSNSGTANLRFKARLPESEAVVVRYKLPFGLDAAPQGGAVVCTKDGAGGEKVGDVLRYCTEWSMKLAGGGDAGGVVSTVASFGGALGWKIGLCDVAKAESFEKVVEALTSNVPDRTDEVVLVFERPTTSS